MEACSTDIKKLAVRCAGIAWIFGTFVGCASVPKTATTPPPPTSAPVGNNTTIVAIAPAPGGSQCSLPEFLGLPNIVGGVGSILQRLGSRVANALDLTGRFPGLQPQPPLLALSDPANLDPGAPPAVQAAAEIKQEEDAAPQKIMALRYLASIGCGGCYPKVEEALLEGLSDCTEEVRFEAVKALQCKPDCGCKFCSSPSCCSMAVRKRLEELTTCEKEPSDRIRRLARLALACCSTKPLEQDDIPREGPPELAPELAPVAASSSSKLFDGIQLVSFEEISPAPSGDMVLAMVNGEPIFESQALPLLEARMRDKAGLNANDPVVRRQQLTAELTRLIDWKLISQHASNDAVVAVGGSVTAPQSPEEIQVWFERRLQLNTEISSQELMAHYEINKEMFRTPQKVRWERVTVKTTELSSRQSALAIAMYLRNRSMQMNVEPPAEFSRDKIDVQTHDWTDMANIGTDIERTALAQLQPGQISNTIDTDEGVHLVRLLERQGEGYQPITAVVDQIRNAILADRKRAAELRLLGQLRSQSKIWTVFDAPVPTDRPVSTVQSVVPASTEQR